VSRSFSALRAGAAELLLVLDDLGRRVLDNSLGFSPASDALLASSSNIAAPPSFAEPIDSTNGGARSRHRGKPEPW
jgi:hypothetical protein